MSFVLGMLLGAVLTVVALGVMGRVRRQAKTEPPVAGAGKPGLWVEVTAEQFGERWPFTVEQGHVTLTAKGAAVFRPAGDPMIYGLNGVADHLGYASVVPIWRDHPEVKETKISLFPMIQFARRAGGAE